MTTVAWVVAGLAVALAMALAVVLGGQARRDRERRVRAEREVGARGARIADLTDRVASREAVLSAMADGVSLFGPDGRVFYTNPAARDLLGRRFERVSEVTPEPLRGALSQASAGRQTVEVEFETGGRVLQATATPVAAGAVVLVARDVTAPRLVDRVRRDFVANASHELKTPVASIVALTETIQDAAAGDPEAVDHFLRRLGQESLRLSRLVGDLLDLSRLEGEMPESGRVSLGTVVIEEAERLRARAEGAGLRLVVEAADGVAVEGSAGDLGLLVHNLLDNAIQYSPDGGEVRAIVRSREGHVELRVTDTGLGIPARDLDRVFERFYRVDPARSRSTGGTGLGLAIVRHVAESHGGEVQVRSVLGAGSTFIVRFPLARS